MKEINELKAKAYDIIGNLEYLQNELKKYRSIMKH